MGYSFSTESGTSLYVEETGSGPPVLALHGIGGGAYFFGGFAKRLESRYRIFSVDLPGTGNSSSGIQPFTLESIASDLGDFVSRKIGQPVFLVGHSFGTLVALKAWETWPKQIRALVFTCGLPKVRPNVHERLSMRAADIRVNGMHGWGPKMSAGVYSKATLQNEFETVHLNERIFEGQNAASYVRAIEVLLGADLRNIAPTIQCPCMSIAGIEDSYAPPADAHAFVSEIPEGCREEVIQNCGHMPFFEMPEKYAELVGSFLDSLPA